MTATAGSSSPNPTRNRPATPLLGECSGELAAIAIQDPVLVGPTAATPRRRGCAFTVAVARTKLGKTCFCSAAGVRPGTGGGYDLALTGLADDDGVHYVATAGRVATWQLLDRLPYKTEHSEEA